MPCWCPVSRPHSVRAKRGESALFCESPAGPDDRRLQASWVHAGGGEWRRWRNPIQQRGRRKLRFIPRSYRTCAGLPNRSARVPCPTISLKICLRASESTGVRESPRAPFDPTRGNGTAFFRPARMVDCRRQPSTGRHMFGAPAASHSRHASGAARPPP